MNTVEKNSPEWWEIQLPLIEAVVNNPTECKMELSNGFHYTQKHLKESLPYIEYFLSKKYIIWKNNYVTRASFSHSITDYSIPQLRYGYSYKEKHTGNTFYIIWPQAAGGAFSATSISQYFLYFTDTGTPYGMNGFQLDLTTEKVITKDTLDVITFLSDSPSLLRSFLSILESKVNV